MRRVFASTTSAPAFGYDPYGKALQATAPATDFTYAGMFYNADSGLNLTQYRAYDPVAGRWLSRDPLGEMTDPAGNLYAYVGGSPQMYTDPSGRAGAGLWGALAGGLAGLGVEWWNNGNCASLSDYARAALIGAIIGGIGFEALDALGGFSGEAWAGFGADESGALLPNRVQNSQFRDALNEVLGKGNWTKAQARAFHEDITEGGHEINSYDDLVNAAKQFFNK